MSADWAGEPHCIAVIDDDSAVLEALRFLLSLDGFDVDTYLSGREFFAAMSERVPACIILDHRMPGMTGLEIAAQLRADGCLVPIIMLSGALDRKIETRAFALGISHVISKPTGSDLAQIIRQCIDESRAA